MKFGASHAEKTVFLENWYLIVHQYNPSDVDWLYTRQYRIGMDSVNGFHIQDFLRLQEECNIESEYDVVVENS